MKLFERYRYFMFHAILYKSITRVAVIFCIALVWDRFVSDGTFTMWEAPLLLEGVVMLTWAWVNYLRLDGMKVHHLGEKEGFAKKKPKRHATRSIVDFADEKIVSFEELEPEERIYCSMLSCLYIGLPLVLIGIITVFI